jgi:uncharacterized membrane protein YfcA
LFIVTTLTTRHFSVPYGKYSTMSHSRKRAGHPVPVPPAQKTDRIPAKQRTNGSVLFAFLFGAFGLLIALFAADGGAVALVAGALAGAAIGYFIGKHMEKEVAKK